MGDKFNVNAFLIDLYFHFNWFSKRHNIPAELCSFCDQEYLKITTFHSVWWFGLSECLTRALKLFPSLKCHPSSPPSPPQKKNAEIKGREISVSFSLSTWSNSVVQVCCQFLNSALTLHANLNSLFQRHIPVIYVKYDSLSETVYMLLSHLMQTEFVRKLKVFVKWQYAHRYC